MPRGGALAYERGVPRSCGLAGRLLPGELRLRSRACMLGLGGGGRLEFALPHCAPGLGELKFGDLSAPDFGPRPDREDDLGPVAESNRGGLSSRPPSDAARPMISAVGLVYSGGGVLFSGETGFVVTIAPGFVDEPLPSMLGSERVLEVVLGSFSFGVMTKLARFMALWCRRRIMNQKARNDAASMTTTGTTIATIRVVLIPEDL